MRTILFIVLSTFIAQISLAQQDTLIIKLDDYGKITIVTKQLFSKKGKSLNFDDIYSKFYADFQKIDKSDIQDNTFNIRYLYDEYNASIRSIKIEKSKKKTKIFYFQDSIQQIEKPYNYTLSLKSPNFYSYEEVQVAVNNIPDFEKITKYSIDSLYEKVQSDLSIFGLKKRIAHKIMYEQDNVEINMSPMLINSNKIHDYISIYPSFGMSVINSNFAPEIDINIDFALYHKSKMKYKFGVNTSFLFIQDENDFFKIHTYNIANVYYHLFIRDNSSHRFGVGYMYQKTGPHFNGDTWTASWQYNLKRVGIKLGGYFTKNLEGNYVAIPSIGFDFGF